MAAPADARERAQEARLLADHSCFHLPADWTVTALSENSRPGRPAALTLRTSDGERHLWGIPIDER